MTAFKEEFYKKQITEYGTDDVRSLGWGSKYSQEIRFDLALDVGIKSGDTVLDVGCGYGDFYKFLISKDIKVKYTGLDTNPAFIAAAQEANPGVTFFCENVLSHWRRDVEYVWVVASGVFCFSEEDWERNVYKKIKHMLLCSKKGVSINFLSSFFIKKKQEGFKHCDPKEVIEIIKIFNKPFCMRHDYIENDFTVYLFKREGK